MARSRNIKPGFFLNDTLADIHPLGRLLFIGLWTIADFKGCLPYAPRRIKAQVLPYDECDVAALMINLEKARFIRRYVNNGQTYIKITNFESHQNPHKNEREAGSDIPDIDEKSNEINELTQDGTKTEKIGSAPADSLLLIPDSLPLIPDSSKAQAPKQKASKRCPADFVVTRDMVDWASGNGITVDLNAETEKFRDHEYKAAKTDWLACWRTWMRNAQQYKREPQGVGGTILSFRERDAQMAAERVASVAPSISANKTAPYVDAADLVMSLEKPKPLDIANE